MTNLKDMQDKAQWVSLAIAIERADMTPGLDMERGRIALQVAMIRAAIHELPIDAWREELSDLGFLCDGELQPSATRIPCRNGLVN